MKITKKKVSLPEKIFCKPPKTVYQYSMDGKLITTWRSVREAAKNLSMSASGISNASTGKLKMYKNFIWSFALLKEFITP